VVNPSKVKEKLDTVFSREDISRSVLVNHYSEAKVYGVLVKTFINQEPLVGIVTDYVSVASKADSAGLFKNASFVIQFTSDVTLNAELDTVELLDEEYNIAHISPILLGPVTVGNRVILIKKGDTQ